MSRFSFQKIFLIFSIIFFIAATNPYNAFGTTSSNCINTTVGNPVASNGSADCNAGGAAGNPFANYADQLAKLIDSHCPSTNFPLPGYAIVNRATQGCLDRIIPGSTL